MMTINSVSQIIVAKREDLDRILEIKKDAHEELYVRNRPDLYKESEQVYTDGFIASFFTDKAKKILIYKEAEVIAGYMLTEAVEVDKPMMTPRKYLFIHDLVVSRDRRSNGVGTELMRAAEYLADIEKASKIELSVHSFNENAQKLYIKLGYGVRAVRMEKEIQI